jgi:hypothetical protein
LSWDGIPAILPIAAAKLFSARKVGLENNFAGGIYSCTLRALAAVESWFFVTRSFLLRPGLIGRPHWRARSAWTQAALVPAGPLHLDCRQIQ